MVLYIDKNYIPQLQNNSLLWSRTTVEKLSY